jgi:hypothetical protein
VTLEGHGLSSGGPSRLLTPSEVRIQFGSEQEAAGVPASFIRHPWEEANLDAEEQQRLFARALVKHRQTVKWIYKASLILDNRVQNNARYHTWRTAEDKFRAAVDDLARHIDMVVLARALS